MTLVERHPLDDRLGFGLVPLNWNLAESDKTSRTSRDRAHQERGNYEVEAVKGKKWAFEVRRRGNEQRHYSVRYDAQGNRGWCSCLGFRFQTVQKEKGPCPHLWLVRLLHS